MQTMTIEALSKLNEAEFSAERERYSKDLEVAAAATQGRPSLVFGRSLALAPKISAAQEQWDAEHPGAWERYREVCERGDLLRDELDRRRVRAERDRRAMSVLDEVPRLRDVVVKGLSDTAARDAVADWARGRSWCLLLLGGVGCGKSTAAAGYAVWLARENNRMPVWVRAVRASRMSGFGAETEQCIESWRNTILLVIDDLGAELMTPTWQQMLEDVLDFRYQHSLLTILPSNLSADEFKARYGERIADRIRHDGTVRTLDAKSMRRKS